MKRAITLLFFLLLIQVGVTAQEPPQGSPGGKEGQKSTGKPSTLKIYDVPTPREAGGQSADEVADYLKIAKTAELKEQVELIEVFLRKYPESLYNPALHQLAAECYQRTNNSDKLIEHGEKSLESSPGNAALLAVIALTYASRGDSEKAIDRGTKAASLLESLELSPKVDPAVFAAQRNRYLAITYAGLGTAFLNRYEKAKRIEVTSQPAQDPSQIPAQSSVQGTSGGPPPPAKVPEEPKTPATDKKPAASTDATPLDLAKAKGYFSRALELDPDYEYAEYQLALIYAHERQVAPALEAFSKVIAMGGPLAAPAKEHFERIYKIAHQNSLHGSEELLDKAKSAMADRKSVTK